MLSQSEKNLTDAAMDQADRKTHNSIARSALVFSNSHTRKYENENQVRLELFGLIDYPISMVCFAREATTAENC